MLTLTPPHPPSKKMYLSVHSYHGNGATPPHPRCLPLSFSLLSLSLVHQRGAFSSPRIGVGDNVHLDAHNHTHIHTQGTRCVCVCHASSVWAEPTSLPLILPLSSFLSFHPHIHLLLLFLSSFPHPAWSLFHLSSFPSSLLPFLFSLSWRTSRSFG